MASFRPASRMLGRFTTTTTFLPPTSSTRLFRPLLAAITPKSHLHTSRRLRREDQNSSRTPEGSTFTKAQELTDKSANEPTTSAPLSSGIPPSTIYSFEDLQSITSTPDSHPNRLVIDVREPSELLDTGRIPGAQNLPIKTAADAFFMSAEDFEDRFGFARPGPDDEVIFYCKAGVRSRAAARLAGQAGFGGKYGEFPGSFDEWAAKGGKIQRD